MILFKKATDLRKYIDAQSKNGLNSGFIPTMGALHEGHISLLAEARNAGQVCICSIFVNPLQFNDPADYRQYPVTIEKDILLLETAGCDILFLPSVEEIYPDGIASGQPYELGYLETILEGKYRPGHFQGVCRVVQRLLEIVLPGHLYLGQKDYQQCLVIKKLLQLTGLEKTISIHISPTLREKDGLAMSSRNLRLDATARKTAPAIYEALDHIRKNCQPGELETLKEQALSFLVKKGLKVDYIAIADAGDLQLVDQWDGKQKLVALVAAFLKEVRLIDNVVIERAG